MYLLTYQIYTITFLRLRVVFYKLKFDHIKTQRRRNVIVEGVGMLLYKFGMLTNT
jgi:hypothetical protein